MLTYWLIFCAFTVGAYSYASTVSRAGMVPAGGAAAEVRVARSIILTAAGFALLVLIGFRYHVGGDWANYRVLFNSIAPLDLQEVFSQSFRQEPGYILINWIAAQLGLGIWFVNLICAVPFTYGLVRLCRQQPNPWLALLIATPFLIIVVGMGYTRQAAALGCLMVAISMIIDRRPPSHFIFWILAGAFFHKTVLVFLPVLLLTVTKNKFISWLLVFVSLVFAYYSVLPSAFDTYTSGYIRQQLGAAGATVRLLMNVVPAVIVLLFGRRFYWSEEERAVWRTFAVLCLVAGAALPFINSTAIIDRLAIYLIPMQIFAYARIGYSFGLLRRGWLMWTTAVVLYSAAVQFTWLNYADNAFAWLPYRNYLTAPEQIYQWS
jgi:EpsG family